MMIMMLVVMMMMMMERLSSSCRERPSGQHAEIVLLSSLEATIPANQSDFVVFVPIFSSKEGEKSEQYDFYVGRRRNKKLAEPEPNITAIHFRP